MKALILALLTAATATVTHAQTTVFEKNGSMQYVMVPTDKARDARYIEDAALQACGGESVCTVMVWADSLDKPTGWPFHPRYRENQLAEFQRNYGTGVARSMAFNCKLILRTSGMNCF